MLRHPVLISGKRECDKVCPVHVIIGEFGTEELRTKIFQAEAFVFPEVGLPNVHRDRDTQATHGPRL